MSDCEWEVHDIQSLFINHLLIFVNSTFFSLLSLFDLLLLLLLLSLLLFPFLLLIIGLGCVEQPRALISHECGEVVIPRLPAVLSQAHHREELAEAVLLFLQIG